MSAEFDEIVKAVDKIIDDFSVPGKWGAEPKPDPSVPFYIVNPPGNPDDVAGIHKLTKLGRYGNWVGDAFGGGKLSPGIDLSKFADLTDPVTVALLQAKADQYLLKDGVEGVYWQDPQEPPRDEVDALGRFHDLLYGKADDEAAARMLRAARTFAESARTPADRALLESERLAALEDQARGRAYADVWWLSKTKDVVGDNPYSIALKNIGDIVFGVQADYYFLQNLDLPPADVILHELGGIYGSRIGQLIAGEDPFTPVIASALGRELGEGLADFLTGKEMLDLGDSLLELFDGGLPLVDLFEGALREFGIDVDNASLSILSEIATTLIGDAAEALSLEGLGEYVFTEAGEALADYLTRILSTGDIDTLGDLVTTIGNDIDFGDIANFLIDLAIDYVTNDFVSDLLADARGIVDIDSFGEGIVAELGSLVGSIIGSLELPWFGGEIGATIGHILGSIAFEVLDFLSFGLLEDLFGLFHDDPEPRSWFYVHLDPATGDLVVADSDWKRDGIETEDILKIHQGNRELNDAFMAYVNGVIDSIGGTADGSFFFPIPPESGGLDPSIVYRNHAMVGFDTDHFLVRVYWGGHFDTVESNDPQTIVSNAIAYELAHLNFYGGDLAQIRALHQWEASLFSQLLTPPLPPELADILDGVNLPSRPLDPKLGLLGANLQVAKDYRFYLDNSETINYLMMQAPQSGFALGWLATLTRAAELGLNAPYVGSPHGGAGTATGESILSADGDDLLFGNGGDDLIKTYGGDDVAYGGDGNDDIQGGSGRDTLLGDLGDDRLRGGTDEDSLFGYQGNDLLSGEGGDDEMAGEAGDDTLDGGLGDDVLFGDIPGEAGRDLITGGDGDDLARGGAGDDRIGGDSGADRLYGDEGTDEIDGGDGNDRIEGGAGSDRLHGGGGGDRILGDDGDDLIAGGTGADLLYGLAGADGIEGDADDDRLFGDDGDDTLSGGDGDDEAGGWKGDDRLDGGQGSDRLAGQDGSDRLFGGAGDDTLYGDRAPEAGAPAHSEGEIIAAAQARLGAGDFTILYQGPGYSSAGLTNADHDLIIVNPAKSAVTGSVNGEQLWSSAEVDGIEAAGKTLIAYLNVAKINDFTNLWNPAWTIGGRADDLLAPGAPSFLGSEDSAFDHTRLVNFWDGGWRDLLAARIATIVEQGFSGLFLDDVLEYFSARGDTTADIAQAAREMRDLIIDLVSTARTLVAQRSGPDAADSFLIIVNGAPFLIQDASADGSEADSARNAAFYASLDGFLAENYFSQGLDYAIEQAVAEYGSRGIALLSVDTDVVTEEQRIAVERAAVDSGFLPEVVPDAAYGSGTARFVPGFGDVAEPGNDVLDGGLGDDLLFGGGGSDTASYASIDSGPVTVDLRLAGAQATGGGGFDTLDGIENLTGTAFADVLTGDSGANVLQGGGGGDRLDGGAGGDTASYSDAAAAVTVSLLLLGTAQNSGGAGIDTLVDIENLRGSAFGDALTGNSGGNLVAGAGGNDVIRLEHGGEDGAFGDEGNDVIYFGNALSPGDVVDGGAGRDAIVLQGNVTAVLTDASLAGIESISIQSGANSFFGDMANNFYDYDVTTADGNVAADQQMIVNAQSLRAGEDFTFDGSAESDGRFLIYGGHGVDDLTGGDGADVFFFEGQRWGGADKVDGGAGRDSIAISAGNGFHRIEFGADGMTGIESISLNNQFASDPSQKPSYELVLHNGNVAPGSTLIVNGSSIPLGQVVNIDGRSVQNGSLILFAGGGHDVLIAGAGADLLFGGGGADALTGGAGTDIFRYDATTDSNAGLPDLIGDFQAGADKIDLGRIDANAAMDGNQAFSWIGASAFSGVAGQLRVFSSNGYQRIEGDTNGDGSADLLIVLQLGTAPVGAGDFLL